MTRGIETELKLTAESDEVLAHLAAISSLGPARLGPPRTVEEHDAYLDTLDGRLAAAGWACRLREREGRRWISLKGPPRHAAADPVHRRPELEGPSRDAARPASWPPSPARDLVLRLAGGEPLRARLGMQQLRTERSVSTATGRSATLSLDRVEVVRAGRALGRLWVVELEQAPDVERAEFDAVAASLLAFPGLAPEPASKLELALEMIEREAEASR